MATASATAPCPERPTGCSGWFARGSGHNEKAIYSERPDVYVNNVDRLAHKFETARHKVPGPVIVDAEKPEVGIIAYGTSHWAIEESLDQLRHEQNIDAGYCRLRAFPFTTEVHDFINRYQRVYVVDQNRDGQMLGLLRLECSADQIAKLRSVRHYDGLPLDARTVTDEIASQEAVN